MIMCLRALPNVSYDSYPPSSMLTSISTPCSLSFLYSFFRTFFSQSLTFSVLMNKLLCRLFFAFFLLCLYFACLFPFSPLPFALLSFLLSSSTPSSPFASSLHHVLAFTIQMYALSFSSTPNVSHWLLPCPRCSREAETTIRCILLLILAYRHLPFYNPSQSSRGEKKT